MASIKLKGDTSGEVTISAPSVAGTTTLELPATSSTLATQNSLGVRNLIINGDMRIDQRNAGASVTPTNAQYHIDRWRAYLSQASKYTVQQSTTAPSGFNYSLLATSSSAYTVGASDYFLLAQPIEGLNSAHLAWGTSDAKTVTLSFWVRSSLTGTFGGAVGNAAGNRSYPYSYTISSADTWEKKTITIAGDTSGTWVTTNASSVVIYWSLGSGSSSSGTAGAWSGTYYDSVTGATSIVGTSGATLYITGVQLEVGEGASDFEHLPYDVQLRRCQRYYEVLYGQAATGYGILSYPLTGNVNSSWCTWFFKQQKRALPTFNLASGASWQNATPAVYVALDNVGFVNNTTFFYSGGSANTPNLTASAEL
jgi:hypothetical protein